MKSICLDTIMSKSLRKNVLISAIKSFTYSTKIVGGILFWSIRVITLSINSTTANSVKCFWLTHTCYWRMNYLLFLKRASTGVIFKASGEIPVHSSLCLFLYHLDSSFFHVLNMLAQWNISQMLHTICHEERYIFYWYLFSKFPTILVSCLSNFLLFQ